MFIQMVRMPEDSVANTVDPERLLAWGNSQLQKIEKERKQKKSNPEVENDSKLTNKKRHIVEYSYTERKQSKVFQEYSEEQEISNTQRLQGHSKSFDRLEMKESEDLVHASKKKKRKKDKCELVSVNIELKKGDISYETNFSKSNKKKSKKRNDEGNNDEVRKMKKKKKDCLSESDENLKKSYVMWIKLTESGVLNTAARDNVNKDLKLKNKKKTNVYSNDSERQGGNLEIEQNELSPPKKKKKHKKDIYEKSSMEESNLETLDPNESISKKKTKKKKMRDSYCIEHEGKKILSDVNEIENEDNVNANISVHTKKGTVPSENGEADSPTVHKKKKKKNKEKTDNAELNTSSEVVYISDTSSCSQNHKEENISVHTKKEKSKKRTVPSENGEADSPTVHKKKKKKNKEKTDNAELNTSSEVVYISDTSSCLQNHKKKKEKKIAEIMEETSSEIYAKKKKNKKREKNMESLDNNSVFSMSRVSTCSSKTEKTGKLGMNFGKSAISRLLTNRESCNACCEMNTDCSRKICNNDSIISTSSETNTKDNNQEEPNKEVNNSQVETIHNSLVTIKQEKIDTEVQNYLPANITIKQEKIDEPPLNNPTDICGEMTPLNQNVQVKQEVCDMFTEHSPNHGEKNENVSEANVNHENGTHETANVGHDNVNDIPVLVSSYSGNTESGDNINSTNDCLSENQNRQTCRESTEQYYMDSYESYYNFCDNKLTVHEEIGVYNEAQNHNNSSSEIKVEKRLAIMNNEEILKKDVNYEADVSHPNQNIGIADCVINSEQVSNEEICHNYGVTNIEDNDICHNITANNKDIEKSLSLNYIPLSNVEQHNQADASINIRTVHQENSEIHVTVNQFHSHQSYQSPTGNEFQSEQHYQNPTGNEFQSEQYYQNPIENEYHYQQTKLTRKKNKESHKSRHFNKCQSNPLNKSVLFSCIRPQFKLKEQVARLLHIDISQVEFCYYRMNSKYYQDVHVRFSTKKQFQSVIRHYANKVRCKSWHIKEDKRCIPEKELKTI